MGLCSTTRLASFPPRFCRAQFVGWGFGVSHGGPWMVVFFHLRGRIWNPRIEFWVGHIIKVVGHAFHHTIFIGMTLDCDGYFCFRCRVEVLSTRRTSPECLKVADGESVWLPRPDRFAVAVTLRSPDPALSPWMNWTVRVLAETVKQ